MEQIISKNLIATFISVAQDNQSFFFEFTFSIFLQMLYTKSYNWYSDGVFKNYSFPILKIIQIFLNLVDDVLLFSA